MKAGKAARLQKLAALNKRKVDHVDGDTDENDSNCDNVTNVSATVDETESCEASCGWREGRRIVELGHLAEQLRMCGNAKCDRPLYLHNITREERSGYASILYITCECGMPNQVTTGKSHRDPNKSKRGRPVFDINTKAVLGK